MLPHTLLVALPLLIPQETAPEPSHRLELDPSTLVLEVGERAAITARVTDLDGEPVQGQDVRILWFTRDRDGIAVKNDGTVEALRSGTWTARARAISPEGPSSNASVVIEVPFPPLDHIEWVDAPTTLHEGVTTSLRARLVDVRGADRGNAPVWAASANARVEDLGDVVRVTGVEAGSCLLVAESEGMRAEHRLEVVANPVRSVRLDASHRRARTGDVVTFEALGFTADGAPAPEVPVHFAFEARPDDDLAPAASGQIQQDGRFVAEAPGIYTVVASCGAVSERRTLDVGPRDVQRDLVLVGRGAVQDVHTSDLWVWKGLDGRDYCVTGTWGANGEAIFWDVTDPSELVRISTVAVDARTVNDVKVSEDGALCVISREGASNRKNGIVLIDVRDPRTPEVLSEYTENLTGGVHNLFIYQRHVYALSAGRWYAIIDVSDPRNPHQVGSFELEEPGHSIHDVWVEDGIAYSSNWSHGVQVVDVGGGGAGGSPQNPVRMGHYAYPSGWNHAAFPYRDPQTGKFYVIAGDEAFPYGLHIEDSPTYPRGWLHFIDFTDMENPQEVARYQVPEAGTHNFWVEDDLLYVGYYNGGLRVVDLSGDLMGDLYRQGREVSWFLPTDPNGKIANAPMVWGPQPHEGHVFFSDWNSGLWAVKLEPKAEQ